MNFSNVYRLFMRFLTRSRTGFAILQTLFLPLRAGMALMFAIVIAPSALQAQTIDCNRLAQQLQSLSRNSGAPRMSGAAQKQQAELARTVAYAQSIGCNKPQFLFFGDRPAQCDGLNARIQQMQANVAQLQRAAGGDPGLKRQLQAQYDSYCRNAREPNFLEKLFGGAQERTYQPNEPIAPDPSDNEPQEAEDRGPARGSMAVCVRTCDGGFFPVSYSARRADMNELQDLCTALCPNTEAKIYTRSPARDIKTAVSADGQPYMDLPAALKFEKAFDKSCTCKPPNQSWAEALAEAERLLGQGRKSDILVTPEKAEELSRPKSAKTPDGPAASKASRADAAATRRLDLEATKRLLQQKKIEDEEIAREADIANRAPIDRGDTAGIDPGSAQTKPVYGTRDGLIQQAPGADGENRRLRMIGPL